MNPINTFKKWLLNILRPYIEGSNKKKEREMKRYIILTLTAGFLSPIAAKAENYKLLVKVSQLDSVSTSVLTMATKEACEEGKKKVLQKSQWNGDKFWDGSSIAAICIKSK
tara:strand:- start:592 stop:924 length:333 start_codon:yes stop_codon:yes gene_type:complete